MLVLFETSVGYAIFKVLNEKKLQEVDSLWKEFETPEKANKIVKLKHFEKFQDTAEALAAFTALMEGKINKQLKKVLKKIVKEAHEPLAVADAKLGGVIKEKLNLSCIHSPVVNELMRGIRSQMDGLIPGVEPREMAAMCLGLAHSLSRYRLKFSADKVDTMIVQAISLLDDLDKELNNYIMRCREWYGWHFPELGKIISDNLTYCKCLQKVGDRKNYASASLSEFLSEEVEAEVKAAAEISMGTEVSEEDICNILHLCTQISRMLAAKTVLAIRYDAFGEDSSSAMGIENRAKLEARLRILEDRGIRKISGTGKALAKAEKYEHKSEVKTYDPSGDSTLPTCSKKRKIEEVDKEDEITEKKAKKAKIKIKAEVEEEMEEEEAEEEQVVEEEPTVKKKKKKDKKKHIKEEPLSEEEPCTSTAVPSPEKKKKKKKKKDAED
ncbi:nucleolar protein 58 isoform 6 [Mus musculus]|uniref:nucleolar protein 58 isoform 6 n=1 Tax=Mus musculus TaxID=10090 RepID=UPI002481D3F1|nr:nucleolar protein 58 isoform 6 [Mus musculus]